MKLVRITELVCVLSSRWSPHAFWPNGQTSHHRQQGRDSYCEVLANWTRPPWDGHQIRWQPHPRWSLLSEYVFCFWGSHSFVFSSVIGKQTDFQPLMWKSLNINTQVLCVLSLLQEVHSSSMLMLLTVVMWQHTVPAWATAPWTDQPLSL